MLSLSALGACDDNTSTALELRRVRECLGRVAVGAVAGEHIAIVAGEALQGVLRRANMCERVAAKVAAASHAKRDMLDVLILAQVTQVCTVQACCSRETGDAVFVGFGSLRRQHFHRT